MKWLTGLLTAFILLLSACGITKDIQEIVEDRYQLEDVIESSVDSGDVSKVYTADKDLVSVASYLQDQIKPNEVSEVKEGKQILVYDDYIVTLSEGEDSNTLVEVATVGFVRDNYQPSFFDGLLAYYILDEILDVDDWGKKQKNRCKSSSGNCYGGYSATGGAYKGPTNTPSFRGSSSRGGGPGTGK